MNYFCIFKIVEKSEHIIKKNDGAKKKQDLYLHII